MGSDDSHLNLSLINCEGAKSQAGPQITIFKEKAEPKRGTEQTSSAYQPNREARPAHMPGWFVECCFTSTETTREPRTATATFTQLLSSVSLLPNPGMVELVECCFTSTKTVDVLGTGAQDGHLDFHRAPELWPLGWHNMGNLKERKKEKIPLKTKGVMVCMCVCVCVWGGGLAISSVCTVHLPAGGQ